MRMMLAVLVLSVFNLNVARASTYICDATTDSRKALNELLGRNIAFREDLEITLIFDSEIDDFSRSQQGSLSIRNLRNNKTYDEVNVVFEPFNDRSIQSLLTSKFEPTEMAYHITFSMKDGQLFSGGDYISIPELDQDNDQLSGGFALCNLSQGRTLNP